MNTYPLKMAESKAATLQVSPNPTGLPVGVLELTMQIPSKEDMALEEKKRKEELAKELIKWYMTLKSRRTLWERLWQEVRELIRPNAEDFTKWVPRAQNRKARIFDNFPTYALNTLSSGLHSFLTNPASRWFNMTTGHQSIDEDPQGAIWLDQAATEIYDKMCDPHAGFNVACHEFYLDTPAFGNGILHIGETDEGDIRMRSMPLSECHFSENQWGEVDTLFRYYPLSRRAAIMQFGAENLAKNSNTNMDMEAHSKYLHAVYPVGKGKNKSWKSVYIDYENAHVVDEGMFEEFPYLVCRWFKFSGDVYGRGPGTDCLQDVRLMNEAKRIFFQSSQLQSAPPIAFENDGVLSKLNLQPWGQIMIAPGSKMPQVLDIGGKINITEGMINDLHQTVGKNFYNDLFDTPSYGNRDRVTKEEIDQNSQERLRQLSPVLGRFEVEFLSPMISRVYKFLRRTGQIKPPPHIIGNGRKLKIEYMSPAYSALRAVRGQNNLRWAQTILPFSAQKPEIADAVDLDYIIKKSAFAFDVDPMAMRTPQAVAQIRQARQQDAQIQAQSQAALNGATAGNQAAQGIKAVSGIPGLSPGQPTTPRV